MKTFIHCMYENKISVKYDIICYTTHGCSKQYRCENAMWLLYLLELIYRMIINICINAPGHGRRKIYGINVSNKTYSRKTYE